MADASTIFALSSAPGRAAVAVVRVSGPAAGDVLSRMAGGLPEPRQAMMRILRHPTTRERLDQALVLYFKAPASETGEDVAELQVHGGRAVLAAVLDALAAVPGCRLAEPGEFARRAFANGKLDLAQAEGLADLIDAETEGQRRQALAQASGALSRLYGNWRRDVIAAGALVEAAIDFSEEADVSDGAVHQAEAAAETLLASLEDHLADGHRGEILRDGFRIVLAGPPNAGKSSLLNALARREVAIVSAEAGTTRDVIEVRLDLAGLPVIVTDTAGIRQAAGAIEAEGIRRALAHARSADLVLWLNDATAPAAPPPPEVAAGGVPVVDVATKVDLSGSAAASAAHMRSAIGISALTGQGMPELIAALSSEVRARIGAAGELPVISQARHRQQVERAAQAMRAFLSRQPPDLELRAEELRRAATALGRITGRIDAEDVLDQIFSRFCIGK